MLLGSFGGSEIAAQCLRTSNGSPSSVLASFRYFGRSSALNVCAVTSPCLRGKAGPRGVGSGRQVGYRQ